MRCWPRVLDFQLRDAYEHGHRSDLVLHGLMGAGGVVPERGTRAGDPAAGKRGAHARAGGRLNRLPEISIVYLPFRFAWRVEAQCDNWSGFCFRSAF